MHKPLQHDSMIPAKGHSLIQGGIPGHDSAGKCVATGLCMFLYICVCMYVILSPLQTHTHN